MKLYKSYFFRNKDPAIDSLRTIIQDETGDKQLKTSTLKQIEEDGGPTVGCMQGWFRGKTRRPQSASLEAAGRAVGYKRGWIRMKL